MECLPNTLLVTQNKVKYTASSAFKEFSIQLGTLITNQGKGYLPLSLTDSEAQGPQVTCPK